MVAKTVIKRIPKSGEEMDEDDTTEFVVETQTEEDALKDIIAASEKDANFDIFENVGQRLANANLYVKYAIHRAGILMGHRMHPYSWERLQEEFGGGHYTVTAKHPTKHVFIKRQMQVIHGESLSGAVHNPQPQPQQTSEPLNIQPQFQQPQIDPISGMAQMMGAILAPLTQLIGAVAQKPQSEGGENSITKVIEHVNRGQQMQFEMLSQMMKSSMEESKRSMEFQMKILEKVNAQIDASMTKGDRDKYSAADVLKATQDAQQAGFQLFAQMQTMASQIAEEKVAALPADGGKDTVTTLIEALAPLVLAGMTGGKGMPKQLAPSMEGGSVPSQQAASEPRLNFPRVELPDRSEMQTHTNKMGPNPQQQRQNQFRPGAQAVSATASPAAQGAAPQARPRTNFAGLSTVRFAPEPTPPAAREAEVMGATANPAEPVSRSPSQNLLMTKYLPILSPIFMGVMEKSAESGNDVLTETLAALDRDAFDWRQFVMDVPTHHVVAAIQGLPEEYATLFRNFYGAAQTKARNATAASTSHTESPALRHDASAGA